MGLFSTRRAAEAATSRGTLNDFLVGSDQRSRDSKAKTPVSWNSALAHITVWACVQLRADLVSSFPIDAYRRRAGGASVEVTVPDVLQQPSGDLDDIGQWVWASQVSLDLRGNAFGLISSRDRLQFPRTIELFHPDQVHVWRDKQTGRIRYRFDGVEQDASDVWHERAYVPPGGLVGMSPISVAASSIAPVLAAQRHSADWFEEGAHPTQLLQFDGDLDPTQASIAKDRYVAMTRNSREPVVLGGKWDVKDLQVSARDAMFLEQQEFGVQEICRLFGTPPEMVGASSGNSLTYATVEGRSLDYLAYRLGPVVTRRERHWSAKLMRRDEFVKLNTGSLLRTDLKSRYASYQTGIASKFMHPDEARDLEDLPPLTDEQRADLAALDVKAPTTTTNPTEAS